MLIKEDSVDMKGIVKKLSDIDYDAEIKEARTDLARAQTELLVNQRELEVFEQAKEGVAIDFSAVKNKIEQIPREVVENSDLEDRFSLLEGEISTLELNIENCTINLNDVVSIHKKLESFIESFDIDAWKDRNQDIEELTTRLEKVEKDLEEYEVLNSTNESKIELLKQVPCGENLRKKCLFVKDAYNAYQDVKRTSIALNQLSLNKTTLMTRLKQSEPDKVLQYIEKYELLLEKKRQKTIEVANIKLDLEKQKSRLFEREIKKSEVAKKLKEQQANLELVKELKGLEKQQRSLEKDVRAAVKNCEDKKALVLDLYKKSGGAEQHVKELELQKDQFEELEKEYTTLDLLTKCMHADGISYDIIKRQLPIINNEISKVLTNIVDFEIFFENEGNRLNILIQHPGFTARPIEMGSGAEKTISAMAIRLALLNVSTLPKSDVFVLDEPGTSLDADNMEGFIRILDMIKGQFKTVLLISHLDSLKDVVDQQIIIDKKDGFASVQE